MEIKAFDELLRTYVETDVDGKIQIYCSTRDLTEEQYMVLLRNFPRKDIKLLERALA